MTQPYMPQPLPLAKLDWDRLTPWISRANRQLGLFDGMLASIVNPAIFLSPLTTQEAVLSSRIEGTQTNLREVMLYEAAAEKHPDREPDIQEVINYRDALLYAVDQMAEYPINLNMMKRIHAILLDGVRGRYKGLGEFRREQKWIGAPGTKIAQARYVPPAPEHLLPALDNWEKYIHAEDKDPLVQLAIVHAQFEIIHPFVDGNGRLGRILIPLFLFQKKWLSHPLFYISAYLEAHRDTYYDRLFGVSETQAWEDWIIFFLQAVEAQAEANTAKARAIMRLYEGMKRDIPQITRSQHAIQAIDAMFRKPIFNTADFTDALGVTRASASTMLNRLKAENIVTVLEEGAGRKATIWGFHPLLSVLFD